MNLIRLLPTLKRITLTKSVPIILIVQSSKRKLQGCDHRSETPKKKKVKGRRRVWQFKSKNSLVKFSATIDIFREIKYNIIKIIVLLLKILFAHRWRLINVRFENIARSPLATNKYTARKSLALS